MERTTNIGDLAKASKEAEFAVREWLAVLELDRVLDASPDELDGHRLALRATRQNRMELISRCTERLMARVVAAADTANTKVLLNPAASPAVVHSGNHVAVAVVDFRGRLGIEHGRQSLDARRWVDAAMEARDRVLETGAEGANAAMRFGNETLDRAKSVTGWLSSGIAERVRGRRGDEEG